MLLLLGRAGINSSLCTFVEFPLNWNCVFVLATEIEHLQNSDMLSVMSFCSGACLYQDHAGGEVVNLFAISL